MKKYELTDETLEHDGHTLYHIKALVDIPGVVAKGKLGGWIESEENLLHNGGCWVGYDARVYGHALVSGDAVVYGDACVFGAAMIGVKAMVSGNARVYGNAMVVGNAKVFNYAEVYGDALIDHRAIVHDNAVVSGNAEIRGSACVHGNARVGGSTEVCGNARLCDGLLLKSQDYACFGPIGSREAFTTLNKTTGTVCTGCFKGTLDEFEKAVEKTHGGTVYGVAYKGLIAYFRTLVAK